MQGSPIMWRPVIWMTSRQEPVTSMGLSRSLPKESISIVGKRANQINISLKEELHNKLEEFASHTDSLEEIHENKEQIEISRAYERMPNPALLATQEFLDDKVYFRRGEDELFS